MRHIPHPLSLPDARRVLATALLAGLTGLAPATHASAQTFTRILGTGDPVPGGVLAVGGFPSAPACGGDTVVFSEFHAVPGGSVETLYRYDIPTGAITRVVARGDAIPGWGNRVLTGMTRFAVDRDGSVAFLGTNQSGFNFTFGILSDAGGSLHAVVDSNRFIPGTFAQFTTLANITLRFDDGAIAFTGGGRLGQTNLRGAFVADASGTTVRIAGVNNLSTPLGQMLDAGDCDVRDGRVVFTARFQTPSGVVSGIYTADTQTTSASYQKVIDSTDIDPVSGTTIPSFGFVEIDEDDVAYYGFSASFVQSLRSSFHPALDNGLALPGGLTATSLERFHADEERIVFEATTGGQNPVSLGLFLAHCGRIDPILAPGDSLDGRVVSQYLLGDEALDGDRLAMLVQFTDGTNAIYVADLTGYDEYGQGLAGTGGFVPRIDGFDCPEVGTTIRVELRDGAPSLAGGLFFGLAPTNIPFLGGTVLVRPDAAVHVVMQPPAPGYPRPWRSLTMPVPADPGLVGTTIFLQSHFADPAAVAGVSMSPGFRFTLR